MKNSNFKLLMERYLTGKVSEQERKKIEAWLKLMKAERTTELRLTSEDQERLFQRITNTVDSVEDVVALYPKKSPLAKLFSQTLVQIAASVLVLLSLSFVIWSVVAARWLEPIASGKEKVILNDGTLVWLNDGSKITYYQKEGSRHAEFKGEALFEVAKIPNSVFTIACGSMSVKVMGTSFTLKTSGDSLELKVLTGRVNLSSLKDTSGINVVPNQKVIYTVKGAVLQNNLNGEEVDAMTLDTEYNMKFSNTPMEDVIARIEEKFNASINVLDPRLNDCRVTVDMTDNSLDSTLSMITQLLDVTYERSGTKVELAGRGCN